MTNTSFESPILEGIRILDFSWVLAGPYATRLLADFGAEVIKVQPLLPKADDQFSRGYYNTWNRNKRGITLNLSLPEGIEIAKKLVKCCDIVVENFSPRVMTNWGLDYPELRKIKPEIIFLSMSVMGHSGPWQGYSGFGPAVQAFSGLTGLTAYPGQPPCGIGYALADHVAGLYASLAVQGALEYRRRTGKGQYIDLSQTETLTSLLSESILSYTRDNQEIQPPGNRAANAAPHGIYRCQGEDRWCAIAVATDQEWENFKQALGNPEWAQAERFSSLSGRQHHSRELDEYIQGWASRQPAVKVMSILQKAGVPAGIVQNAADLANDPQLQFRHFFLSSEHSGTEKTLAEASPIRFSHSLPEYRQPAPNHGQDNDYVYRQLLGFNDEEISRLKQINVI